MKVTVDGKTYEVLSEEELTNVEVIAIEKAIGQPISTWAEGSMSLITGLVWVTVKREIPELRFKDVVFQLKDLDEDEQEETEDSPDEAEGKPAGGGKSGS